MKCSVFAGIAYYHRLKHLVRNKIHARHTGPVQLITRQPVEGRARHGGLRIGEMERDALIAHGAARVLRERLCLSADATAVKICNQCGTFAVGRTCSVCQGGNVCEVTIPYAFKLLKQELEACHIDMKLTQIPKATDGE